MNGAAQFTLFHAVLFVVLSLLCACISLAMRSNKALIWLGGALLCGAVDTMLLDLVADTPMEQMAILALLPATYICYARAVRHATQNYPAMPGMDRPVAALACISLILLLVGAPYAGYAIPFNLACALIVGESGLRIFRARSRHVLDVDNALAACLAVIAGIYLVRMVSFPLLFGLHASYAQIKASSFEAVLATAAAVLTAPAGILLLARIVGTAIGTWRNRAERDYLTGLLNREAFDQFSARSHEAGGAVVFCDIDDFKRINDSFGHHGGDQVIRTFGGLLACSGHVAGRLGGDEFAVVMIGSGGTEAAAVAETIRHAFHTSPVPGLPSRHRPGASFGVATFSAGRPPMEAFRDADAALYRAKETGRNRVHLIDDFERAAKVVPISANIVNPAV